MYYIYILVDPAQVIGLFPDLLPREYRLVLQYPSSPTELGGAELEKGLTALVEYLTQKRQDLAKESSQQVSPFLHSLLFLLCHTRALLHRHQWQLVIQWVISSMVLKAGIGVNNQNSALTSTLTYYQFKNPIRLKLELTFDCQHQHQPWNHPMSTSMASLLPRQSKSRILLYLPLMATSKDEMGPWGNKVTFCAWDVCLLNCTLSNTWWNS